MQRVFSGCGHTVMATRASRGYTIVIKGRRGEIHRRMAGITFVIGCQMLGMFTNCCNTIMTATTGTDN